MKPKPLNGYQARKGWPDAFKQSNFDATMAFDFFHVGKVLYCFDIHENAFVYKNKKWLKTDKKMAQRLYSIAAPPLPIGLKNPDKTSVTSFFKIGQRVKLLADESEGFEEENGVIDSYDVDSDTYVVLIDSEFLSDDQDDGYREVSSDQLRPLKENTIGNLRQLIRETLKKIF
jgi:hypothetical protein